MEQKLRVSRNFFISHMEKQLKPVIFQIAFADADGKTVVGVGIAPENRKSLVKNGLI